LLVGVGEREVVYAGGGQQAGETANSIYGHQDP